MNENRITAEQFLDRMLHISKKTNILEHDLPADESDKLEESDRIEDDPRAAAVKGTCISCMTRQCDIILLPCFDIVVCSTCWSDIIKKHETNCEQIYKNNKRKQCTEKRKVVCPCCGNIVNESKEFRMATF